MTSSPLKVTVLKRQEGIAFFYVAALLVVMLAFSGLAVDLGRGYVVKANLSKAVDGAALAAARAIGEGQSKARDEANRIFKANFPDGYLGVKSVQNPPDVDFGLASDGATTVTVTSNATLATTFMKIAGFEQLSVSSSGQATRRLVDMSFVLDKSGSLSVSGAWANVQKAAKNFVSQFDENQDRVALIMYSSNTVVFDPIRTSARGFNKVSILDHIEKADAEGYTATSEGLYRGWDELRRVEINSQSSLRVIVLFTDGFPNSWSADFTVAGGTSPQQGTVHTYDFPEMGSSSEVSDGVPDPNVTGLTRTLGTPSNPASSNYWNKGSTRSTNYDLEWTSGTPRISALPTQSSHPNPSSLGMKTKFDLFSTLVGGDRPWSPSGQTKVTVRNVNNAARNLVEIIANEARTEVPYPPSNPPSPPYPIRIYTLGLGTLLRKQGGAMMEKGEDILKRIANDPAYPATYRSSQPPGMYVFAANESELDDAFQRIRNQIIRLSQ